MNEQALLQPQISANDRLVFTVFIGIIIHALVILGITFSQHIVLDKIPPTLDVIIVNNPIKTEKIPEKAEFIANADQQGGGTSELEARPQSPFTAFEQSNSFGIAPIPIKSASEQMVKLNYQDIISTISHSSFKFLSQSIKKQDKDSTNKEETTFEHDLEMAQLANEISDRLEKLAKRPRKAFINARTKSAVSAKYMANWIKKVERIGNLNYPEKARNNNLFGNLILVVAIKQDGSLFKLNVRQSSGSSILDQAAKNIVKMAAPFAKFTQELKKQVDILYITRTWQFQSNNYE